MYETERRPSLFSRLLRGLDGLRRFLVNVLFFGLLAGLVIASFGGRTKVPDGAALVLKPRFLVLDEPTSALDVSVQAQIVDLLRELQERHRLAYMFISHDLRVVRALADDVLVLKDGKVVEHGPAAEVFERPRADYTKALMAAAFALEAVEGGVVRQ